MLILLLFGGVFYWRQLGSFDELCWASVLCPCLFLTKCYVHYRESSIEVLKYYCWIIYFSLRFFIVCFIQNLGLCYYVHTCYSYFFLMCWPFEHYKIFTCCWITYFVLLSVLSNIRITISVPFATAMPGLSFSITFLSTYFWLWI